MRAKQNGAQESLFPITEFLLRSARGPKRGACPPLWTLGQKQFRFIPFYGCNHSLPPSGGQLSFA